jgi:hypothetical protein
VSRYTRYMLVIACSGPGAAEAIQRAWLVGYTVLAATVVGVVATAMIRKWLGSRFRSPGTLVGLVFVLAHPGFWCLPIGGDCGGARMSLSAAWGGLSLVYVVGASLSALVASRR